MKIYIAGSFHFAKEMMEAREKFIQLGHEAIVPIHTEDCCNNPAFKPELEDNFEKELAISLRDDVMRCCFNDVAASEAFVAINLTKNGVPGYIGTSVLMEMAVAYHLRKKIYILHEVDKTQKYAPEVYAMQPKILNGDLLNL